MKSIAPVLREMKINDSEKYPIKRYTSIANTIQRLKHEGFRFTTSISGDIVIVTKLHG